MTSRPFTRPGGTFPTGAILPWPDSLSDIPGGWVLCDGNNGTPNLLDRFAVSVPDSTTDPGGTVGTNSVTLATGQLPLHSHSGSVGSAGSHNHTLQRRDEAAYGTGDHYTYNSGGATQNANVSSAGGHSHTASIDNVGSGNSIDNKPSHYEVAFIQKL